tara:strand:- start:56 stop:454 length:399 start_codon:yes stop_codon:yes gene_type:complete
MAMRNPYGNSNNKYQQYKNQSIMTAPPEELTLMLYEGALKFLKQAKIFMDSKDIEKTHNAIMRAKKIITELNVTLNMDYEISKNLRSLYSFMNERLSQANMKKDPSMIDEVIRLLEKLKDTWKQAMKIAKTK